MIEILVDECFIIRKTNLASLMLKDIQYNMIQGLAKSSSEGTADK